MKYFYYQGCSLEGTAMEYDQATRAVMAALGAELLEVKDWTCCGASAAEPISYLLSMVLPARNLALARQMDNKADFVIPCSACYLNLRKVEDHVQRDAGLADRINQVLGEEGLSYQGNSRHDISSMSWPTTSVPRACGGRSPNPSAAYASHPTMAARHFGRTAAMTTPSSPDPWRPSSGRLGRRSSPGPWGPSAAPPDS